MRIEPIETAMPAEWRKVVRDQPLLAIGAAFAVGIYLGRHHAKQLVSAFASVALSAAIETGRRRFGSAD